MKEQNKFKRMSRLKMNNVKTEILCICSEKVYRRKKIKNEFPIDNNLNINFWAFSIIWIKNKLTQL